MEPVVFLIAAPPEPAPPARLGMLWLLIFAGLAAYVGGIVALDLQEGEKP